MSFGARKGVISLKEICPSQSETLPSMPEVHEADLNMLSLEQISLIDNALTELGAFGEVRLIKAKASCGSSRNSKASARSSA